MPQITELTKMLIKYLPTALFLLIIVVSSLVGLIRGYHKSKVMFLHSAIIAGVLGVIYFIVTSSKGFDSFVVTAINLVFGKNYIQNALGVSIECSSVTEILIEYIPKSMALGPALNLILKDNGLYLGALVNLIYHLLFFIVFLVIFLVIKLLVSVIYLLTYSEKRYHKKVNKQYANAETDEPYKRRKIKGFMLGLSRGLISSLLLFSVLGGSLYAVTGGMGQGDSDDISFGDKELDSYLNLYKEIDRYGQSGIFKILNSVRDSKDVPIYLYVADLVFRGGYKDEDNQTDLNLRNELANLTGFSKEAIKLMIKYGGEELNDIISGKITNNDEIMDTIVELLQKDEVQYEIYNLLNKFDSETYVYQLAMSLIDSIIVNVDQFFEDFPPEAIDLTNVLFKKGYKSPNIPYEKKMIDDKVEDVLPYIKPSNLIKKRDINLVLNFVLEMISNRNHAINENDYLDIVKKYICNLSILESSRKDEVNPVLGRLYAFIESVVLVDDNPNIVLTNDDLVIYHDFLYYQEVDWVEEINILIDNIDSIQVLMNNVGQEKDLIAGLQKIFDENDVNYYENKEAYRNVTNYVYNSKLVGKLLSSNYISKEISKAIGEISPDTYISPYLVYENQYDDYGNLVKRGELANLLKLLEFFIKDNNMDLFEDLFGSNELDLTKLSYFISRLRSTYSDENIKYMNYLVDSDLLRSLITNVLVTSTDGVIFIPDEVKEIEKDNTINVINKQVFEDLLTKLDTVIDLINPIIQNPNDMTLIDDLLNDPRLSYILNNKLIEGTIANQFISVIQSSNIVNLSDKLSDPNNWLRSKNDKGEISKIIDSINLLNIRISEIVNGNLQGEDLIARIQRLTNYEINNFFDSEVLLNVVSNFIMDENNFKDFTLIVPVSELENDSINKESMVNLVSILSTFPFDKLANSDINYLLEIIVNNRYNILNNNILSATVAYNLANNIQTIKELELTTKLLNDAKKDRLKNYDDKNGWYNELPALIDNIDCFLYVNGHIDLENGLKNIENKVIKEFDYPSKIGYKRNIDVLFDSRIISKSISSFLNPQINEIVPSDAVTSWLDNDECLIKEEVIEILNIIKKYNIDFSQINFDEIVRDPSIKNTITNSSLIRAVISKQMELLFDEKILVKAANAYDKNHILKANEINSFITLLNGQSLNSFDVNSLNILDLRPILYDVNSKEEKTKSYLLSDTISNFIINNLKDITIPMKVFKNNAIIPEEISNIIGSIAAFMNKSSLYLDDLDLSNLSLNINNPLEVIKSDIINATICASMQFSGSTIYGLSKTDANRYKIFGSGFILEKDKNNNNIIMFTPDEFEAICFALKSVGDCDKMNFNIDLYKIISLLMDEDAITHCFKSSIVHIYINKLFQNKLDLIGNNMDRKNVKIYNFDSKKEETLKLYTIPFIINNLTKIIM